jgi:catechol 2,3-dioxygenase-like lactoylglutathione lyase family enzyme
MKISRIESLVYGVEDVDAGIRYFEDWGLQGIERGARGADFRLPSGQSILVRAATDVALPAAPDGGSTLRETVWGVDDAASLERIAAELGRDRDVKVDAQGGLHAHDVSGFAIGFRRSAPAPKSSAAAASRMNRPFDPERRAHPTKLGHVVYNAPKKDIEKLLAFYLERLSFRLTDRALDTGAFMRCAGSNDHHNLFFALRADRAAFNHAAFEVRDIDEVVLGGKYMKSRGWHPNTPVGRHILGSNIFWYFDNPCGGRTEYYADMDQMDDNWKPRIWEKNPGFAMWMMDKDEAPELTRI